MRIPILILLAGATTGCHEVVELPAPDLDGAAAALVVYGSGDTVLGVDAVDVAGGQRFSAFSRNDDLTTEVMVLSYACPLSVLGLAAGRQELRAVPSPGAGVPTGVRLQRLDLRGPAGSTQPEWRDDDPADPVVVSALARMPLPPGGACAVFGAELSPVPVAIDAPPPGRSGSLFEAAVSVGDGRALVLTSTRGQQLAWLVEASGEVTRTTFHYHGGAGIGVPPGHLARDARGRLWHVSIAGVVARGALDEGLTVVGRVDSPTDIDAMVVADDPGKEDPILFLVTGAREGQRVLEYPGGKLVAEGSGLGLPSVVAHSPDDLTIFALDIAEFNLVHVRRPSRGDAWVTTVERLPPSATDLGDLVELASTGVQLREGRMVGVTSLIEQRAFFPRFRGTFVMTRVARGWQRAARAYQPQRVTLAAVDLGGGLIALASVDEVFSVDGATLELYQLDAGSCGSIEVGEKRQQMDPGRGIRSLAYIVPLDLTTTLVITAGAPRSVLIRRSRPGPSCLGAPLGTP